jgi:hypothetical protein
MVNSPACHTRHTFKMSKYMKPNYCKSVYHVRNLQHWKITHALFYLSHVCSCLCQLIQSDHHNITSWCAQIMKLIIMQFSPTSCCCLCLRNKYNSQHLVLKPCRLIFFLTQGTTPPFTSIHNQNKISVAWNYILKILYQFNQSNET